MPVLTDADISKFDSQQRQPKILTDDDIAKFDKQSLGLQIEPSPRFSSKEEADKALKRAKATQRQAQFEADFPIFKAASMIMSPIVNSSLGGIPDIVSRNVDNKPFVPEETKNRLAGDILGLASPVGVGGVLSKVGGRLIPKTAGIVRKISGGAATGALGGALTPGEDARDIDARLSNAKWGAGLGGALPVAGVVIKRISEPAVEKAFRLYQNAIGSKAKNLGDLNKIKPQRLSGLTAMSESVPEFKFTDLNSGEEIISQIPKNRWEFAQAFKQTKESIWKKATQLSKGATEQGAKINIYKIGQDAYDDLLKEVGDSYKTFNSTTGEVPPVIKAIENTLESMKGKGGATPTEAQAYLKYLNDQTRAMRNSGQPIDYSVKDFLDKVRYRLADETDNVIEATLGKAGYQDLRNQYGALKSMEKEVVSSANKWMKQNAGKEQLNPILNIISLEDIISGAVRGNPGQVVRGGVLQATGKLYQHMMSPDRKISQIFELLRKQPVKPIRATAEVVRPTIKPKAFTGITYQKPIRRTDRMLPSPKQAGQSTGPTIPIRKTREQWKQELEQWKQGRYRQDIRKEADTMRRKAAPENPKAADFSGTGGNEEKRILAEKMFGNQVMAVGGIGIGAKLQEPDRLKLPAIDFTATEEGFSGKKYKDSNGHWTIGHGFKIDEPHVRKLIPIAVLSGKRQMTKSEARSIIAKLYPIAEKDAKSFAGNRWDKLTPNQRKGLTDMAYQLGGSRLNGFHELKKAIQAGDSSKMYKEVLNSKYARKDAPNRARRVAELMKSQ